MIQLAGTRSDDSIYDEQVIDAAYLHSYPNCYFIGPFAKRVSFASQQYRAIDLVAALRRKGKLTQEMSVAVIGAGLAGLMTTAALRGVRCKTVHLYEAVSPLHRQKEARHRVVHPTISRWPMEELNLTTRFPFLDWFAGPCDKIIECLMQDWSENLSPKEKINSYDFKEGATVKKFSFTDDRKKVRLAISRKVEPGVKSPSEGEYYDLVFVTAGFGDEHTVGQFKATSYWTPDEITRRSDEDIAKWQRGTKPILVSGCGDGGLIDCLRYIHGNFRDGWLTIELAEMLGPEFDGKAIIENAEHDALMAARSIACMPPPTGRGHDEMLAARADDYVVALALAYREVVKRLPQDVRKLLDDSIAESRMPPGNVTLVSREKHPFVPYSAPIHKLMIAHALQTANVQYISGTVTGYKNNVATVRERTGQSREFRDPSFAIRHGAPANMVGGIDKDELASLRIRQLLMADYIDRKTDRILDPPPNYPIRKVSDGAFIASRYGIAKALISQLAPHIRLSACQSGFRYVSVGASPADAAPLRLQLPRHLFGIEVEDEELIEHGLL
jgi:hypothetical protein